MSRLEDILGATAGRLGLPNHQLCSTPTSLMASFGAEVRQRTFPLRVEPGDVSLASPAELEAVTLDVARGRVSPAEGTATIERIVAAPAPYGPELTTIASGVVSGAGCVFLGGGPRDIAVAAVLVPGILLLVPGSVGFRSLLSPLDRKAVAGIETAFSMAMTAIALVAGLLISRVILPEPRVTRRRGSAARCAPRSNRGGRRGRRAITRHEQ